MRKAPHTIACTLQVLVPPLTYMVSLALAPSALIGVNADMALPKFEVPCNCKPSLFAYPAPVTQETKEVVSTECYVEC